MAELHRDLPTQAGGLGDAGLPADLLLMLPSLLVRLGGQAAAESGGVSTAMAVDIWVFALVFLHWNILLTLAIGAFIVMVMKGPAYVADAYPLVDADAPRTSAPRWW